MKNIGDIKWPDDAEEAVRYYLGFVIGLLKLHSLDYSSFNSDPLLMAEHYLQGLASEEDRKKQVPIWWDYIEKNGYIMDFKTPNALMARFALSLLDVNKENIKKKGEIAEQISWDLQYCDFLGKDPKKSTEFWISYFNV